MATSWARDSFPDFQVAIVYHDDNENHVPHAHVIVNNTNVRTGRRLQDPDPGALNGRLQAISREMGLSHFDGRIDQDHHDTRRTGARTDYQRVHVGREESEIAERDGYSWVADIRARVDIARGIARDVEDLRDTLSTMGVTVEDARNGDWKFALSAQPSRCVTGTRLGTDYQRPNVTRELSSPRRTRLPEGSRRRIEVITHDAMGTMPCRFARLAILSASVRSRLPRNLRKGRKLVARCCPSVPVQRPMKMRTEKPTDAIGKSKDLIESCCKTILEAQGIGWDKDWNVAQLAKRTSKVLEVDGNEVDSSTESGKLAKQILGGLQGIASGVAEFRNQFGTGHGKSASFQELPVRHAPNTRPDPPFHPDNRRNR